MLHVEHFDSFSSIQSAWESLENKTTHYPFQAFWYQKLFAEKFCKEEDVYSLGVFENEKLLAVGGFERVEDTVLFLGMKQVLGGQDLTDYGDLLFDPGLNDEQTKEIWQAIIAYLKSLNVKQLQLDFVREDSKTFTALKETQIISKDVMKQEVAPYLIVPKTWEEYMTVLPRHERHEIKRKIKRFEETESFHFCSQATLEKDFEEFIRLHRLSDPEKNKFMSDEMKNFFWQIVMAGKKNYRVDFCFLNIDGKCVASIMSLIGQGKALLYNSGFDPEYRYLSVGLILHAYLVKKSIEQKLQIHDFLRGNERYKYDLGAKDMQLYKIVI